MKSFFALSLIAKIALGVGTSKLSIGFSTQEPYCETVPTFPDAYSSECNETVAYQTGEDCKTQCNTEIVSTCSCLYSVGGLSKYLFIKNYIWKSTLPRCPRQPITVDFFHEFSSVIECHWKLGNIRLVFLIKDGFLWEIQFREKHSGNKKK